MYPVLSTTYASLLLTMISFSIMIAVPQPGKSWFTRIRETPWSSATKTIPALLIFSVCLQVVTELGRTITSQENFSVAARLTFIFVDIVAYIFLVVPATILLVRVQASTLPDDIQTIVPFDRTFGQDISLTNDALTVKGAMESLDWPVMKRTLGFMAKTVPIAFAVTMAYATVCALVWVFAVVDNNPA